MIFIHWNYYILSFDLISKYFWKCRRQAAIIIFSCWRNHTYISNKVVYLYKSQAHNIACMQGKKATLRWKVVFMVPYFKGRKLIHTYICVLLFWFVIITSRIYLRKKVLVSAFKKISEERILSNWSFWMLSSIQVKHFYRIDVSKIIFG